MLTDLGLAANLFASWEDLQQLAEELGEQLLTLTLSSNRLAVPADVGSAFSFTSLQVLVLNSTALSWAQVLTPEAVVTCDKVEKLEAHKTSKAGSVALMTQLQSCYLCRLTVTHNSTLHCKITPLCC